MTCGTIASRAGGITGERGVVYIEDSDVVYPSAIPTNAALRPSTALDASITTAPAVIGDKIAEAGGAGLDVLQSRTTTAVSRMTSGIRSAPAVSAATR